MTILSRRAVVLILAGLAFYVTMLLNADYIGRNFLRGDFEFGEKEMLTLLGAVGRDRTWDLSTPGTVQHRMRVVLQRGRKAGVRRHAHWVAPITAAYACESRAFPQTASACLDTTSLPLEGTVTLSRLNGSDWVVLVEEPTIEARIVVLGRKLNRVEAEIRTAKTSLRLESRDARTFTLTNASAKGVGARGSDLRYFRSL